MINFKMFELKIPSIQGISENVRRVVGLMQFPSDDYDYDYDAHAHSFLVIGNGFQIDNSFYYQWGGKPNEYIRERQSQRQLDEDPGTTNLSVFDGDAPRFKLEGVDRKKLRLVCTPDEKMEQKLAYETTCCFKPRALIYDLNMRHYIKTKSGVVIPSLAEKWHCLCWNCFNPGDKLQRCAKCKIAIYCSQNCQREDWKSHKELHGMQTQIEFDESMNFY